MLFSNKDLKTLLVPLVIEQILVMLVGMVDTVMVSSVGDAAVSGVALAQKGVAEVQGNQLIANKPPADIRRGFCCLLVLPNRNECFT